MKFSIEVDEVIDRWRGEFGLSLNKEYKGSEIRQLPIIDDEGNKYELWLETTSSNQVVVCAHESFQGIQGCSWKEHVDIADLESSLNQAYRTIQSWMTKNGSRRTPV